MTADQWASEVEQLCELCASLDNRVAYLVREAPSGSPSPELLGLLLDLRARVGVESPSYSLWSAESRGQFLVDQVKGAVDRLKQPAIQLFFSLDRAIVRALDSGVVGHPGVVRSADFGAITYHLVPLVGGQQVPYALAFVDSLAADHPARDLLPRRELYLERHLVLGRAIAQRESPHTPVELSTATPQPFYLTHDVTYLTRSWQQQHLRDEANRQAKEEANRRAREEAWKSSPEYKQAQLEQRVRDLEQQLAGAQPSST